MEAKKSTTHLAWTPQLEHPTQTLTSTPTPAPTAAPTSTPAHAPAPSPAPTPAPTTAPTPSSTPTPTSSPIPAPTPAPPPSPTQEPTPTGPYTQHISCPPTFAQFWSHWGISLAFFSFLSTSHHHLTPSISTTTTTSEVCRPLGNFVRFLSFVMPHSLLSQAGPLLT
jgi:outer membrane biosynthesis protein TonB